MRIYFTASLRGKKDYNENYLKIIKCLSEQGNKVYSDHITGLEYENVVAQDKEESQIFH